MFDQRVVDRIHTLGGEYTSTGDVLARELEGIGFERSLYDEASIDGCMPLKQFHDFVHDYGELLDDEPDVYYDEIHEALAEVISGISIGELNFHDPADWLPEHRNDAEILANTGAATIEELSFVQFAKSGGFPDMYLVSLTDPNPSNPLVYPQDHETLWTDFPSMGSLADFFDSMLTGPQLAAIFEAKAKLWKDHQAN